jgi:hypothetical protein
MFIPSSAIRFLSSSYYIPSRYPQLINPCPLPRSIPLSLIVPKPHLRFSNRYLFYSDRLSAWRPTPKQEGQSTLGQSGPATLPRHGVLILVAFCDLHRLQGNYSFPRSPNGKDLWIYGRQYTHSMRFKYVSLAILMEQSAWSETLCYATWIFSTFTILTRHHVTPHFYNTAL